MFWRKTISGNDFTPHRVFGYAWKIEFSGKAFHLAVNIMALTRKLFYISIFTSNHFQTQTRREREREREREEIIGTLPHTELHPLPHAKRSQSSPSRSSENFHSPQKISRHSLSSFTPSPSRRTKRAIAGEAQIQSSTHGPVGLIAPLKLIVDLIAPPQLLHCAQTHLR